jgi:DNA-binding NarL/FixJ family response regulator
MDVDVSTKLMEHRRLSGELDRLTAREREVLSLMAQGTSNRHIGEDLFIDRKTVETHVSNIFAKLNLTRVTDDKRVLAVLAWLRMSKAELSH